MLFSYSVVEDIFLQLTQGEVEFANHCIRK